MKIKQVSPLNQLSLRTEAYEFISKVLHTSYPVAIWRLPLEKDIVALIDLSGEEKILTEELETITEGFVINSYHDSHPVKSILLQGHLMITIDGENASLKIHPTVTGGQLENFEEALHENASRQSRSETHPVHPDFEAMVREAVAKIKNGELHKVVLSRYADFDLPEGFDPIATFETLTQIYPNAFCHLTNTQAHGLWMGATPEKLIAITENKHFSTDALAGTQPLSESMELCDVAWTQKEIEEQAMVSRYIIECFKKIRLREYEENGPKTVKAGNLAHLKTEYTVDMEATNTPMLGSTMLELLHPTSAVCGAPRSLADEFIKTHEAYDRSLYAGFLGPVSCQQRTSLFVNLRCMQVINQTARLYAGAGITEDSNPAKELAETNHKMQTLLKVLDL